MTVSRRNVFGRLVAAAAAGAVAFKAGSAVAETAGIPKVAYHLSDLEKVGFVLGNIANHIEGMGGPGKVSIVLVVHGPALNLFHTAKTNPEVSKRVEGITSQGVELDACGNTMKAQEVELTDLLPGFVRVDQGGVTRLAQLQAEGYAYLRP